MDNAPPYVIEMLHITKEFPGIKANDDITLQLKKGEIHALLGENGAGKSTLMSVLFGLYQPEAGEIRKNGKPVKIDNPNDATALGIGMVHQHFKLIDVFTVLDNIILGAETTKLGFIQRKEARKKVEELSEKYGLKVDLDAKVEDITVGMQQRVEILKMLYRDNEILIFDEPTAVLTPQEIDELMATMKEFAREGKSILFISHKLNEIMAVADRVTVLRKGRCIGTVNTCDTNKQELSNMMVGRPVQLVIDKTQAHPGEEILHVEDLCVLSHLHKRNAVDHVSFSVRAGEIVHGKVSRIRHNGRGLYEGLPQDVEVGRYHSLIIDRATLPDCLEVTSELADGTIMGVRHKEKDIEGIQFHPESILTPSGRTMMQNFLNHLKGYEQ